MAIVKFVTSDCPMNNIFPYVMRKEATEQRLISGIECSPDTALEEFRYVKQKYGKEKKPLKKEKFRPKAKRKEI